MIEVTWSQVLAWRMRRQFLLDEKAPDAVEVTRRIAGVQAQVNSSADAAVAIRTGRAAAGEVKRALLEEKSLLRTWAMRGTLHLLPADEAPAYLALAGAHRTWEKGAWQKMSGATPADLEAMAAAAEQELSSGAALSRDELTEAIVSGTGLARFAELLKSGWGSMLKPLAYWGVLCHGPSDGGRVSFVSPAKWIPGWPPMPTPEDAAPTVIRAFLAAHGPTTADAFDKVWLSRGFVRKPQLRGWFKAMDDELATVRVDGEEMLMLSSDVAALAETKPVDEVRLVGGFDPYILGAGTANTAVVPAERRKDVSRAAGWISPVVLHGGRAIGTWKVEDGSTSLWEQVPAATLRSEVERVVSLVRGA